MDIMDIPTMIYECVCGMEYFSEASCRLHVQRKHGSVIIALVPVMLAP